MRISISYSHHDKAPVQRIVSRLEGAGHVVLIDSPKLRPGDNLQQKIVERLESADLLVAIVSKNSFRSSWVQKEFSAIVLQQLSKRERLIIPVKIDAIDVPSYLAPFYLDLSENFDAGLERLVAYIQATTPEALGPTAEPDTQVAEGRTSKVDKLREALRRGRLTLVCGAGVSVLAGIPAWEELLIRLLGTMMERISKDHSLDVGKNAAAEFQRRYGASSLIVGKYLKNNLGKDFQNKMREALYSSNPTSSPTIDAIVHLSRPLHDGRLLDSIVTFNFDCLVEENLTANSIHNRPIFSEAVKHGSHELPIYHVHGYLPRTGRIPADVELVFSEDAYHGQFIDPFSWSNLIQLAKLTQNTCLFVGISLTDPNMRRLLDVAWRKNPDKVMSHYIVKKLPRFSDGDVLDQVSQLLEEQDANAFGLNVIWIDDFDELPAILSEIAAENNA